MSADHIPQFDKIVADSDFDGLCGAAILKKFNPDAEVIFSHAALIRSGSFDSLIDSKTAIVDLPWSICAIIAKFLILSMLSIKILAWNQFHLLLFLLFC